MKTTRTKTLVGLALTSLALAGSSSLFAAGNTFVISTFDTDITSQPYTTNLWHTGDTPTPTAFYWTNVGNPPGAMDVQVDYIASPGQWDWQDNKTQVDPWSSNAPPATDALDLSKFDVVEFDINVNTNTSQANDAGQYGGIGLIVQTWGGWGNNPTNIDIGYHQLGNWTVLTNGGYWQHISFGVSTWPWTVGRITFSSFMQQNTNHASHEDYLIDNLQFRAFGQSPTMSYVKATRGLNIWQSGGQYDRNSVETYQDGTLYYMWSGNGAASYSFTIGDYPAQAARSNFVQRMMICPTAATGVSPDWNEPNIITMELGYGTNSYPTWMFHWKTNSPTSNGDLYTANAQISLSNNTTIGKWTLSFDSTGTGVTMSGPNGASTNFTMGVHPNIPDISGAFQETGTNHGTVYLGSYASGANSEQIDLLTVFTAFQISGAVTTISNNWLAETTLNPLNIIPVGPVSWYLVPTNNANWVNWTVPDGGFVLQTNTLAANPPGNWSTNHGLPAGTAFPKHKGVLVKPGDVPNTKNLLFRLSSPGY